MTIGGAKVLIVGTSHKLRRFKVGAILANGFAVAIESDKNTIIVVSDLLNNGGVFWTRAKSHIDCACL